MKNRILLADDVEELAKSIGKILLKNNYNVDIAYNGLEVMERVKDNNYDCIILDVMMPYMDGIEAIREIRKLRINTPIILLTARDLVEDKIYGLDIGANDYLTKPFEKDELLARIRVQIRTNKEIEEKYQIGNVFFDKAKSELSKGEICLTLNEKECQVINYLVKNQERKVNKYEIAKKVWNDNYNNEIVPIYIEFLQEKFIALNANIRIIENDGYFLDNIYNIN